MPPDPAARLLAALEGLDLTSADGRAGIRALLTELDRLSPDAILRQAASIELRRVGWGSGAPGPGDPRGALRPDDRRSGGEASGAGR